MSLINQMLRDLEQRQSTQVAQAQVAPVGVPTESGSGAQRAAKPLLLGLGLGVCVLLVAGWQMGPTLLTQVADVNDAPVATTATEMVDVVPAVPEKQTELTNAPVIVAEVEPAEQAQKQTTEATEASPERASETQQATVEEARSPSAVEVAESLPASPPAPAEPKVAKQRYIDPAERARLLMNSARQHMQRGQVMAAIGSVQQALKLQPAWPEPRTQLVKLYRQQGRWIDADRLLKEALKAEPESAYWALMRARGLWQQQDRERAVAVLEKARTDGAHDLNLDLFLAALYQRGNQHPASAAVYQDILQQQPGHAKAWLGLAISLQALQQPKDALAAFQQALRSGSHAPKVRQYIEQRIAALRT